MYRKPLSLLGIAVSLLSPTFAVAADAQDSAFVPAGYVNVFRDEMEGKSLDTSKWWTRYIYEDGKLDTLNDEQQRFRENGNHVMTEGTLQLTARLADKPSPPRFLYESGMIRSKPTFKYGYFETRVKVPKGIGCWPGFWLNSDADESGKAQWPPEIDFFEFVNNGKDDRSDMLHMGVVVSRHKNPGPNPWGGAILAKHDRVKPRGKIGGAIYHAPFEFPDDYHVVGGLWDTDDTVSIFVDGELMVKFDYKWVHADGREAPYAHVLLNLSIGGSWAGRYGVDDSAFPQAFEVDYVRVYQKPDHKQVGQSTIGHDLLGAAPAPTVAAAAPEQSGPTPYPDPKDDAAWPGQGPIRVFKWMVDNRAFYWTRRQADQGKTVFVGDSLTANWKGMKAAFPQHQVANRGIGGDVSRGVLFRLKEDVLDLHPKAVVLLIGTNDLSAHADPATVADNVASIVKQLGDAGTKVVLCTVPPRNSPTATLKDGALADLNARIKQLATDQKHVTLLDLHAALANAEDGSPNAEYFQPDMLHLGPKAYEKWAELLNPILATLAADAQAAK